MPSKGEKFFLDFAGAGVLTRAKRSGPNAVVQVEWPEGFRPAEGSRGRSAVVSGTATPTFGFEDRSFLVLSEDTLSAFCKEVRPLLFFLADFLRDDQRQ